MKTVCVADMCAGCMACIETCMSHAIKIEKSIFAYNAVIDEKKCISCNACHNICQANHPAKAQDVKSWWQGWAHCDKIRENSASGGVATSIERVFVKNGGIVCSCFFNKGEFEFKFAETEDDVNDFAGSKYVKSSPVGIYKKIQNFLLGGKKILFVGLPCQVSALRNFIEKNKGVESNLFTIDLICHGTPSIVFLKLFLNQHDIDISSLESISFRKKSKYQIKQNTRYVGIPGTKDKYSIAFLNAANHTENCYFCQYARRERVSDLTLGDSWGSTLVDEEKKKGISLILCQTDKGRQLIEFADLHLENVDIKRAIQYNHQLSCPAKRPEFRMRFIKDVLKGKKIDKVVAKYYPCICFKQFVKRVLIRFRLYKVGEI